MELEARVERPAWSLLIEISVRVDKGDQLATAQHEWSSAYSVCGWKSRGWMRSRTLMSFDLLRVHLHFFTSKSRLSSLASTQGSELWRV